MSRPLLITDCDEVLLHMVSHFADWLDEEHQVAFRPRERRLRRRADRPPDRRGAAGRPVWPLLDGFFRDRDAPPDAGAGRARGARARSARSPTSSSSPTSATRRTAGASSSSPATASATKSSATSGGKGGPVRADRRAPRADRRGVRRRSAGPSRSVAEACAGRLAAAHDRRAAARRGRAAGGRRPCADRRLAERVRLDPRSASQSVASGLDRARAVLTAAR